MDPEAGLYLVGLDHAETVAVRNSPLPAMLNGLFMSSASVVLIDIAPPYRNDRPVVAGLPADVGVNLPQVFHGAAAAESGGSPQLDHPAQNMGRPLKVAATRE
ncbi:hypothetical protein [Nocardia sp. NPDC051832]|uniref:hypothetical protein n=1 Tax=Nocardia sp. NPDC051832 TaxID=3155673 RepID=UPI00341A715E